jgi:two-component system, cell cycle sensor histidine kinase and response regulator CckA
VDEPLREVKPGPAATEGLQGTETVLLAEDEEPVRLYIQKVLESHGYTIVAISNPGDAEIAFSARQEEVDLLLTDVVLPGMSGREFAEKVKKLYPKAKVLYISGYTPNSIVHHGVLDPGVSFLQKPFALADLLRKVRETLRDGELPLTAF